MTDSATAILTRRRLLPEIRAKATFQSVCGAGKVAIAAGNGRHQE